MQNFARRNVHGKVLKKVEHSTTPFEICYKIIPADPDVIVRGGV